MTKDQIVALLNRMVQSLDTADLTINSILPGLHPQEFWDGWNTVVVILKSWAMREDTLQEFVDIAEKLNV